MRLIVMPLGRGNHRPNVPSSQTHLPRSLSSVVLFRERPQKPPRNGAFEERFARYEAVNSEGRKAPTGSRASPSSLTSATPARPSLQHTGYRRGPFRRSGRVCGNGSSRSGRSKTSRSSARRRRSSPLRRHGSPWAARELADAGRRDGDDPVRRAEQTTTGRRR